MSNSPVAVLRAIDVFTPNDYPQYTYIERENAVLDQAFERALETPNTVISVSGPSKSGKTVLAERKIGPDNLILVSGAELAQANDLWERVFDILDQPDTETTQTSDTVTNTFGGEAAGKGGVPIISEVSGKATYARAKAAASASSSTRSRGGLSQAEKLLAGQSAVIFIDDFHYMDREVQTAVARQIRAASGRGIKFCVASVPHRSDDVVRSNHELRGRTTHIDTTFWSVADLTEIGRVGFACMLMRVPDSDIRALAVEACGSPQLMQQICLQACLRLNVNVKRDTWGDYPIAADDRRAILEVAATHTDYGSLVRDMHTGPRTRGTDRKSHQLTDGSTGDSYRAVLLGLIDGDPEPDVQYARLIERTNAVCVGTHPNSQAITSAAEQMAKSARKMYPDQRIIEYDPSAGGGTLSIVDPYLLFYIRNSGKIASLGKA